MKTRIRGIAKGLAVGTGSLALALSLAACGGSSSDDASGDDGGKINAGDSTDTSGDDSSSSEDTSSDEATDDSSSDDATSDDSSAADDSTDDSSSDDASSSSDDSSDDSSEDSDSSGSASDVTDKDLSAAKGQFMDFMKALGDKDAEKACSYVLNPNTNKPIDGASKKVCGKQVEDSGMMDSFTPELVDQLDESMFDAEAQDDGTIKLGIEGSSSVTMQKADDGKWYFIDETGDIGDE